MKLSLNQVRNNLHAEAVKDPVVEKFYQMM